MNANCSELRTVAVLWTKLIFLAQKMPKIKILTSVWGAQHPNAIKVYNTQSPVIKLFCNKKPVLDCSLEIGLKPVLCFTLRCNFLLDYHPHKHSFTHSKQLGFFQGHNFSLNFKSTLTFHTLSRALFQPLSQVVLMQA